MKSLLPFAVLPIVLWVFYQQEPNDASNKMLKGLKTWYEENPQEKVYVQTDRDRFVAGETVWIKAWVTLQKKPTFLSRILYVELADAKGKVVEKKMYQIDKEGSAHGAMDLSKDLPSGAYSINAYTSWMLNYPQFVFRKTIQVYGDDYSKGTSAKTNPVYDLQFFPEGGDLVEGVKSKIALKAVNKYGYPVQANGSVISNTGEKIADFTTEHDGMTSFELQPVAGATYSANVTIGNQNFTYKLPAARAEGVVLQVTNSSASRMFIQVQASEKAKEKYSRLFAIAHMNGVAIFKGDFKPYDGENATTIAKKLLPAGIVHITVFDTLGRPLAERIAYVSNYDIVSPELRLETKSLQKRGLNTIRFTLDSVTNPNLSFVASDASYDGPQQYNEGLASALLLTSDLKGYVHNPGYYFSNKSESTIRHLDLLMMTHGWRRFNWKQISGDEKITLSHPIETNMRIAGKVTKADRKELVTSGSVSFIVKAEDSTTLLSTALLTDKGEFIVDSLMFRKAATISYDGKNAKNSLPVDVQFYPSYIDTLKLSPFTPVVALDTMGDDLHPYIASKLSGLPMSGKNVLQGITVKTKKKTKLDSLQAEYVSPMFENSDMNLVPERTTYANIWQYFNASITGFNVNPFQPGGVTSATFNSNIGINALSEDANSDRTILFLLNEIPVTADVIDALVPTDVALVKVYKGALAFPFGADGGAIAVYTKKGVGSGPSDKKFSSFKKLGFDVKREFYSPNYANYNDAAATEPDNRATLVWKPSLKKEADGSYKISFYNNDSAKKIRVIVQGIDENGELIYKEQIIQ